MCRPCAAQIKITQNSDAELQSATATRGKGVGGWGGKRKMKGKEKKRQIDKERENILPLCQYNIYANHAFSVCVNFITHKRTNTVAEEETQSPKTQ